LLIEKRIYTQTRSQDFVMGRANAGVWGRILQALGNFYDFSAKITHF